MAEIVTTIINNAPRAITFGALRATHASKGRLIPGDKIKLTADQLEDLRRDPIVRALIKAGDITDTEDAIDVDEDPNDLDALDRAPVVRDRAGRAARIDTAFSPERARSVKPAPVADFSEPESIDVAPSTIATATTIGLSDSDAIALVNAQSDLETLKAWFTADERASVRTAINARGAQILKG
jgi:hypothetical protein